MTRIKPTGTREGGADLGAAPTCVRRGPQSNSICRPKGVALCRLYGPATCSLLSPQPYSIVLVKLHVIPPTSRCAQIYRDDTQFRFT